MELRLSWDMEVNTPKNLDEIVKIHYESRLPLFLLSGLPGLGYS